MTIEEIEKRRTARRAALSEQYNQQRAKDMEALDGLEETHGPGQIARIDIAEERYFPGLVTMACFRLPSTPLAKRFKDQSRVRKDGTPGDVMAAAELLAHACLLYPDPAEYKALSEHFAFVHVNGATACIKAAEGREAEAGKD